MAKENPPLLIKEPTLPTMLTGAWVDSLRNFIVRHLEALFIILIAAVVVAVFYYLPYKIAFLNLFYLPILLIAYVLGRREAVMAATLCFLSGVLFAYYRPELFGVVGTRLNALLVLGAWGGFLILTCASLGSLQERLAKGFDETRRLYEELKRSRVTEEMKEKVERTLYATMDPVVAKLATEGKLRFEKREISIMFTDLTDFTTYSDQNRPDVVLEELNHFLGQVEPIVESFRGHIDKYMGDGVMVEFGAPVDFDRHALMAVLAGLKMQEKVKVLDLPWRLRVGIATGNAIMGMLGVRRQAYTALGDRVNVAKRLEQICEAGKVYIDEPTFRAAEPFVNAAKLRNLGVGRPSSNPERLDRLNSLEETLSRDGETAELLFELGKLSFELHDATAAISYFERALALDPMSTEIRLAYAEANMKREEFETIQLKGKLQKITVYEVTGIKDRWDDSAVIPLAVAAKYRPMQSNIGVPEEVVLGVEALDGSVGHSRMVSLLSYAIADYLKLNEELKKMIQLAGYLQDLGKEAVPHHILNGTGSLSEQESALLEKYVHDSVGACRRMGYVDPQLLDIVLHHHEAWSGSGYPDHLRGEAIPLGSRITAVAEVYSALTSWRPYREALEAPVALSEIRKGMEKGRYDPKVVKALMDLMGSPV